MPPPRSPRPARARPRGASTASMVGGLAAILLLLAAGLTLATRRRPTPQTAADAWSVIPTPPAPAPARRPRTGPRVAPPTIDPEAVAPRPEDPAGAPDPVATAARVPVAVEPPPVPTPPTLPPEAPVVAGPVAPAAIPPTLFPPTLFPPTGVEPPPAVVPEEPSSTSVSSVPPPTDRPPTDRPPTDRTPAGPEAPLVVGPAPWTLLVAGPEMTAVAAEAARRAQDAGLVTSRAEPLGFRTSLASGAGAPAAEVRAEVDTLLLVSAVPGTVGPDPVADLVPPVRLLGALLREVALPVSRAAQGPSVVALAAILTGDGRSALAQLEGAPADVGVRILRAAASLVARDWPAVHKATFGLAEDPTVGPVARVLTGAALRADRNAAEAVRDFEAALVARPDLWIARLLLAEACESDELRFADRAAAAYAAVVKVVPDEPAALLGNAFYVARTDRPAARAQLERLVARAPDAAGAWRMLAWLRAEAGTSEDLQAAVACLERFVAILPDDASAWADLGSARWRWAGSGGGHAAMLAAAEAFARQTDLAPQDGTAWFRRGAAIHQAAIDGPVDGDGAALRARLLESRTCYARALTLGLPRDQAARVHFNLGLVTEFLPAGAPATPGVPATAAACYEAALAADATYGPAAYALVAARVAERDGASADRALAKAPAAEGDEAKRERAVLEAAAAWARNDLAKTKALLVGPAAVPAEGADPVPALARALLVLGYRRATLAVLSGETRDATRLGLRVRAYAALKDADGVRAELARLRAVDPTSAADLERRDPLVASVATR